MFLKILLLIAPLFLQVMISVTPDKNQYKLIAHRGGVVEDKYAENSAEALNEAIRRKYWMVEVDIRETKDGIAVAQHDPDFKRFFNHDKKVGEMTWSEISQLRSSPGNQAPLSFESLVKMCQGKLHLMLDTKEPHSENFCKQIETILKKYNMLSNCYVIGSSASRKHFLGKAKVGASSEALKKVSADSNDLNQRYFLFEHGKALDEEKLLWANANKIAVVPSINKFHYKSDVMDSARHDIVRLKDAGVKEFQIDSEFDRWF